jgi:formamidopyrimidine-DNA glycosylase
LKNFSVAPCSLSFPASVCVSRCARLVVAYLSAVPELPEVEVLVRNLDPRLKGRTIRSVRVLRPKVAAPTSASELAKALIGGRFLSVTRRAKYLLFRVRAGSGGMSQLLVGHLGMAGRMYFQPAGRPAPRHAAVVVGLGREDFVFEDTRVFGRFTLDTGGLEKLGPEPLGAEFTPESFAAALKKSSQAIKVKLLDQSLVAGIGNIYASEALFRARISPRLPARRLSQGQVAWLWLAIRETLSEAIAWGSTVRLDFPGTFGRNRLFYFGTAAEPGDFRTERLRVYDHAGQPCSRCGAVIKRLVQAARGTYYCPTCQRR